MTMEIIRGLLALRKRYPRPYVTIGNFDGLHIGHQRIICALVAKAREGRGTPVAITFDPHPARVLAPERNVRLMTSFEDKARLIGKLGIRYLLAIDFTPEFAHLPAEAFVRDILVGRLGAVHVIVGHNYRFGRGKQGTTEFLRRRGRTYGFGVNIIRNVRKFGSVVSSSRIRSLLLRGRVCEAGALLGRPYHIEGTVIAGAGRGARMLGTPTANLSTPSELVPREGVYVVKVLVDGALRDGVANIGTNPTFGANRLSYEVHLFDYAANLVGRPLKIYFIDWIRDERAFAGPGELRDQIAKDIRTAMIVLRRRQRVHIDL